jgi:hypothetical protein
MDIENLIFQAYQKLKDTNIDDNKARKMALSDIEYALNYCQNQKQTKDWLLELAKESKQTKFKLIARVNTSGLELMQWCDKAYNFTGMCDNIEDIKSYKYGEYLITTYSLEELPIVIDNALSWYNSVKNKHHKFNNTILHILSIDDVC